jgi:hypothetical protein
MLTVFLIAFFLGMAVAGVIALALLVRVRNRVIRLLDAIRKDLQRGDDINALARIAEALRDLS